MKFSALSIVFLCLFSASSARADSWNFPLILGDQNTEIEFTVDSTWHTVHGKTSGVVGKLYLATPSDSGSVRGEIAVPVASFDTDSSRRDARLKEVMNSGNFPKVEYKISGADITCSPQSVTELLSCSILLHGNLRIKDANRPWDITSTLISQNDEYIFQGTGSLRWNDYGVADPSIFIAKLSADVLVSIKVKWKK